VEAVENLLEKLCLYGVFSADNKNSRKICKRNLMFLKAIVESFIKMSVTVAKLTGKAKIIVESFKRVQERFHKKLEIAKIDLDIASLLGFIQFYYYYYHYNYFSIHLFSLLLTTVFFLLFVFVIITMHYFINIIVIVVIYLLTIFL
jgi:hypothetical protein